MNAHQRRKNRRLWRRRNENHVFTTDAVVSTAWAGLRPNAVYLPQGRITISGKHGIQNSFDTHPEGSARGLVGAHDDAPQERNQYQWAFRRRQLTPAPEGTVPPWRRGWNDRWMPYENSYNVGRRDE